MLLLHSFEQLARFKQPVSWALGFFDGFHQGHQAVIQAAKEAAQGQGLCGMITFRQHPLSVLCPERAPQLICPRLEDRLQLAQSLGVDVFLLLDFTPELATLSAQDFLDRLTQACPTWGISMGQNCHFGHRGKGDARFLQDYTAQRALQGHVVHLSEKEGLSISSSRIRQALKMGDLEAAEAMLGRPFRISGIVEEGQKLARKLGFPTANIALSPQAALPPFGVYEVQCLHQGEILRGVANLGIRPSIQEDCKLTRLESHFLHWQGDLYGQDLCIELLRFIRPEQVFHSLPDLQAAIEHDMAQVGFVLT